MATDTGRPGVSAKRRADFTDEHHHNPRNQRSAIENTSPAAFSGGACRSVLAADRRRLAAARCVPLDCGCADPFRCAVAHRPPLTDGQIDAWAAAARHLITAGLSPIVPIEELRAMWRAGRDRHLAEEIHHHQTREVPPHGAALVPLARTEGNHTH